jgi:hypothetical protein
MKNIIYPIFGLLFSINALADDTYDCGEVKIDSMGLAWMPQGKMYTGLLLCTKEEMTLQITYVNGIKTGLETRTDSSFSPPDIEEIHYTNGRPYKSCYFHTIKKETKKYCSPASNTN